MPRPGARQFHAELIAVAIVVIFADLFFCSIMFPSLRHSAVLAPFTGSYPKFSAPTAMVVRAEDGFRLVLDRSDAGFELNHDPDRDRKVIADVRCFPWPRTSGLIGPVLRRYRLDVDIDARLTPLSEDETERIRAGYIGLLEREWVARKSIWPGFYAAARKGDGITTVISYPWLAHDVVMAGLLLFVVMSIWGATVHAVRRPREGTVP